MLTSLIYFVPKLTKIVQMILKVTKKQSFTLSIFSQIVHFLKYIIFKVKAWIFLNETSVLVFAELAISHSV